MAYVDDLAIGQIDRGDISPVSYCSPTGCFAGVNFESYEGQDLVPVYLKKDGVNPRFDLANNHNTVTVLNHAKEFIINNYKSYIVPTEIHGETFLGFTHKLQPSEISNMMIAFDDNGVIPLEDSRVAQTIRKNHPYLKGSSLIKDGVINYDVANKSIAVYNEMENYYVYSFVNGAKPDFINRLLEIDIRVAYQIVTDKVKVPITQNQFVALISLAYEIGLGKFATSKIVKCLNKNDYQCATYFMEFVEALKQKGPGVSTILFDRRSSEVKLFSTV
tara:strand:+ start:564 stop:1388 length:825 start_codon:yes stop_codon:yes gene_type:complete